MRYILQYKLICNRKQELTGFLNERKDGHFYELHLTVVGGKVTSKTYSKSMVDTLQKVQLTSQLVTVEYRPPCHLISELVLKDLLHFVLNITPCKNLSSLILVPA